MASCKANAVEPWAYLYDLLRRLPLITGLGSAPLAEDVHTFLPDTWLSAHPQHRREWSR
jgi:hypothetical protein